MARNRKATTSASRPSVVKPLRHLSQEHREKIRKTQKRNYDLGLRTRPTGFRKTMVEVDQPFIGDGLDHLNRNPVKRSFEETFKEFQSRRQEFQSRQETLKEEK